MTPQQFAHPGGADAHVRPLLEVGGKACTCPAREGVPLLSRVALHVLEEQFHRGRRQPRRTARVLTGLQRLSAFLAPAPTPGVHRPWGDSQCLPHLGCTLPLGRQKEGGGAQRHPRPTAAANQPCQQAALPGRQPHHLLRLLVAYAAHHYRSLPLNGISWDGLAPTTRDWHLP